jgi:hypothetical protein
MKTFFAPEVQSDFRARLERLTAASGRQWGTMDAAQMLAHCTAAMRMVLGELPVKGVLMGLIGWMFKKVIFEEKPFRKNVPTAPEFTCTERLDFAMEKERFLAAFGRLAQGPAAIRCHRHPFFGTLTGEEWGLLTCKHLDHHFRQFGV